MNFYEVISKRKSIRSFQNTKIDWWKISRVLDILKNIPTAGDLRSYKYYIYEEQDIKNRLSKAAFDQNFITEAPTVIIFCSIPFLSAQKYGERGANLYSIQDTTIAAAYVQLAAVEEGLGTCWVGAFDETEVSHILQLSTDHRPLVIMPIGYPKII